MSIIKTNIALSVPAISVNTIPIFIIPNSFKYTNGYGEVKVRSASGGGGASKSVHSENAEKKIGKMSFEMYNTVDALAYLPLWKLNTGSNMLGGIQKYVPPVSMSNASLINDPEIDASADGKLKCEFEGDPIAGVF
jgi:hypothetical protein